MLGDVPDLLMGAKSYHVHHHGDLFAWKFAISIPRGKIKQCGSAMTCNAACKHCLACSLGPIQKEGLGCCSPVQDTSIQFSRGFLVR